MKEIVLDGISISVTKKRIKNMYIRIVPPDGEVRITAPYSMSDACIRDFALARLSWIQEHRRHFAEKVGQPERRYVSGESCYVWGKRYYLDVRVSEADERVYIVGEKMVLAVREGSTPAQREALLNEWLRARLKEAVPELLRKCEDVVGVRAEEWRIKNMRTRWGTCNVQKKRIWLNLQLAKKAPECLEYVITHELVHLLERNHNARFYGYMDGFYPNWRVVKNRLNQEIYS